MQAQHLGAHRVGDVHRARVRSHHQVGAGKQGRQLLQGVLPDQVQRRREQLCLDGIGHAALQFAAATAQHHLPTTLRGVVGHGCIAVCIPVAAHVAGTGRDHQHRAPIVLPLRSGPVICGLGHGQVPADLGLAQAQRLAEAADGIQHMDAGAVGNALVDEEPVQVLGTAAVVADASLGGNERRQQVGAERHLHLQQRFKTPRWQLFAQLLDPCHAALLVVGVEGDAGQAIEQFVADLVDDPVDRRVRARSLQGAHQGHHVGDIAECGQAQEAQGGGR